MSRGSGPRIRSFKPERYHDERMAVVSRDARHLYDGLTTQADDEGRGTANLALVKANVLPFDDDATPERISEWLLELKAADLIQLYEVDGRAYFAITSWAGDQRVDKPTESKLPPPPAESILANPREESANPREGSGTFSPSRAPADLDLDLDLSSSAIAAEQERPEITHLCHLLADLIRGNDPKARSNPDQKRWRVACRLLLDKDERTVEEFERVMRWCQADEFWRSIVLSMPKLREKFAQLSLKMGANGRPPPGSWTAADMRALGRESA